MHVAADSECHESRALSWDEPAVDGPTEELDDVCLRTKRIWTEEIPSFGYHAESDAFGDHELL